MIKNKLKELLKELKNFKVQTILVLDYNRRNESRHYDKNKKISYEDCIV